MIRPLHVTAGAGTSIGGSEPVMSDALVFGDVVYLSGRAPVDPATRAVLDGEFDVQARSVLADVDRVLEAAGSARSLIELQVTAGVASRPD